MAALAPAFLTWKMGLTSRSYPPTGLPCVHRAWRGSLLGAPLPGRRRAPAAPPPPPAAAGAGRSAGANRESAAGRARRGLAAHRRCDADRGAEPPGRDGQVRPLRTRAGAGSRHLASPRRRHRQLFTASRARASRPGRPPAARGLTLLEVLVVVPRLVLLQLELLHQVLRQHLGRFSRGQRPPPPPSRLSRCPGRSAGPSALSQSRPRAGRAAAPPVQSRRVRLARPNRPNRRSPARAPQPERTRPLSRSPAQRGTWAEPRATGDSNPRRRLGQSRAGSWPSGGDGVQPLLTAGPRVARSQGQAANRNSEGNKEGGERRRGAAWAPPSSLPPVAAGPARARGVEAAASAAPAVGVRPAGQRANDQAAWAGGRESGLQRGCCGGASLVRAGVRRCREPKVTVRVPVGPPAFGRPESLSSVRGN